MVAVREVFTRFGIQFDKRSADKADRSLDKLISGARTLANVFVAGAAANGIRNLVNETAALGDTIAKTSAKLGVQTDALQAFRFAAERTGVAQKTADLALQRFTRRAAEAAQGTGEAKDALRELGVQLTDNNGEMRGTQDLLAQVADGLKNAATPADRLRLAFKLFDSEGAALVNTLSAGSEELNALFSQFRTLGGELDKRLIKQTEKYTDSQTNLAQAMQGVRNVVAKELFPSFTRSNEQITKFLVANRAVIRENVQAAFVRIGRAVDGVRNIIAGAINVFKRFFDRLSPQTKSLVKTAAAVTALGVAMKVLGLIIRSGPLGVFVLLSLAVLAIIEDFEAWREGADSVIGDIITFFDGLLGEAGATEKFFRETIPAAFDEFAAAASRVGDMVFEVFETLFGDVSKAFDALLEGDIEGFFDLLLQGFTKATDTIFELITGAFKRAFDFLKEPGSLLSISNFFDAAGEFAKGFLTFVVGIITNIGENIGNLLFRALGGNVDTGELATGIFGGEIAEPDAPKKNRFDALLGDPNERREQFLGGLESLGVSSATLRGSPATVPAGNSVSNARTVNQTSNVTNNISSTDPRAAAAEVDAVMRERDERMLRQANQDFVTQRATP